MIRSYLEMVVSGCLRAVVSAPAIEDSAAALRRKDLLSAGPVASAGKCRLEEHLDYLVGKRRLDPGRPLLAIGLRNNLVNPRALLLHEGEPFAVEGERPLESRRPYFGIGWRDGVFVADTVQGSREMSRWQTFFSGVPVLWDDWNADEFLGHILTEASDHSHVYDLPRGNHPAATDHSRAAWAGLQEVFLENLHADFETASRAMHEAVRRSGYPLERCDSYLHSVLGVDSRGRLVNVVGHGRLEALGRAAAALDCRHAVCVENSGSVMPTWLPDGAQGEPLPLLRAPNFRPKGRALLVLELDSARFETLVTEPRS